MCGGGWVGGWVVVVVGATAVRVAGGEQPVVVCVYLLKEGKAHCTGWLVGGRCGMWAVGAVSECGQCGTLRWSFLKIF